MTGDSALATQLSPSPNFGERHGRPIDALILHYTGMSTGAAALARLCDPASGVSCHYLVWEDGRIDQLVAEANRAWHAGRSFWAGETDINTVSIGIEIVNGGHDGGCPPYPAVQIDAVIALVADICARRQISPARVLGHSDVAPGRKADPGEYFPWPRLAVAGLALAVDPAPIVDGRVLGPGDMGSPVKDLQETLVALGYGLVATGCYDEATEAVVRAVQRRYRPARVDGLADLSTVSTLRRVPRPSRLPLAGEGLGCGRPL